VFPAGSTLSNECRRFYGNLPSDLINDAAEDMTSSRRGLRFSAEATPKKESVERRRLERTTDLASLKDLSGTQGIRRGSSS